MPVVYPTSLDTSTFPSAATLAAETLATRPHSELHDELGQAILQIEQKVGVDSSADTDSIDYKVNNFVVVPVGVIFPFGGVAAPTNFLLCDGSLISTTTYADLHAVIGTTYGSGSGTFGLPDLRGRTVVGLDNMGGTAATRLTAATTLGQSAGAQTHALSVGELATHTHIQNSHTHTDAGHQHFDAFADITAGGGILRLLGPGVGSAATAIGNASISTNTAVNQNTGSGTAHNNLQPYTALNYIIRY